jgi:hypothetical protein
MDTDTGPGPLKDAQFPISDWPDPGPQHFFISFSQYLQYLPTYKSKKSECDYSTAQQNVSDDISPAKN